MSYERKMLEDLKMPTQREIEQALLKSLFNNKLQFVIFCVKIIEHLFNNNLLLIFLSLFFKNAFNSLNNTTGSL